MRRDKQAKPSPGFWRTLIKYAAHPIASMVIGIIATVAFFYLVERKDIDPVYAISKIDTLAQETTDAPDLKLLWRGEEIQNIRVVRIAMWNQGRQYLDDGRLSASDQLRVVVPPDARVLYAGFSRSSRPTLRFSTASLPSADNVQFVTVNIANNDALEYQEGGILQILFTGDPNRDFMLVGRVFGTTSGFRRVPWQGTLPRQAGISYALAALGYGVLAGLVFRNQIGRPLTDITVLRYVLTGALLLFAVIVILVAIQHFAAPPWL